MCHRDHTLQGRAYLGFTDAVRGNFGFMKDHGFKEVRAEDTIIRYETERVFLNVYHGRSSHELGIEVGLLETGGRDVHGYPLGAFVRLMDPEEGSRLRYFCATTPGEVGTGVQRLAVQVRHYVDRALKGDERIFSELAQQQREWASEFADEVAYNQVGPKAAEAFRQQNYRKAAELYESIRGKLTPAELKKLEYAKKHA